MTQPNSTAQKLRKVSGEALTTLDWPDLAKYIDALNEEYEWFLTQINERRIGAHVPIIGRPKR